jgi:hypothetical protein
LTDATAIPVWFVALVLAAAAPWGVRLLQAALERRLRRRTLDFIAQALAARDHDRDRPHHEPTVAVQVRHDEREQAGESDAPRRP